MKIKFLKTHTIHTAGTVVDNHPNEQYLIILGVAVEVKEEKKKKKSEV